MPIVVTNQPVAEIRSLAQRAGAGDRLEREEALRVSQLNRRLAQDQFDLRAQAQAFNQQLALDQLSNQQNRVAAELELRQLQMADQQQQRDFQNAITAATQDRLERDFTHRQEQDLIQNEIEQQKLQRQQELDRIALDRAETAEAREEARLKISQDRLRLAEQARQDSIERSNQEARQKASDTQQNQAALQASRLFVDPEALPVLELSARNERTDRFRAMLDSHITDAGRTLNFKDAINRARSSIDAEIKTLESRINALSKAASIRDPDTGEMTESSSLANGMLPGLLTRLDQLLNDKKSLNPLDGPVSLSQYEQLINDTTRSTLIAAMAKRNASNFFQPRAVELANDEVSIDAQLRGQEPRDATPAEIAQVMQRLMIDEDTGRPNARFVLEWEKEIQRLMQAYGWIPEELRRPTTPTRPQQRQR